MSVGITDLVLLDCVSGVSVTSASTENVVGVLGAFGVLGVSVMIPGVIPGMIPGMDSLVAELSEIEIVLESLEDYVCLSDTVRSLFSLISSCDLLFKPDFKSDFKGKSVLLVAFLEELLFSLGSDVSKMLEESI